VAMRIEAVDEATAEVQLALAGLLPQLNPNLRPPDMERLRRLVADPDVVLLIARDDATGSIVGTTTVIVYTTPFWIKSRIDEVVVDESARGRGVGEALVEGALEVARQRGAQIAELQSARTEARESAHRLYERLGFKVRNSDVFRIALK
jgi:GNAT superfamily N-acetyltransferase